MQKFIVFRLRLCPQMYFKTRRVRSPVRQVLYSTAGTLKMLGLKLYINILLCEKGNDVLVGIGQDL